MPKVDELVRNAPSAGYEVRFVGSSMFADGSFGKKRLPPRWETLLPGYSKESMNDLRVDRQQISTESLILAQDERWRRA